MTTTKKPAPPSERRADLIRRAADLFAEKGFRATTVREIADAAGILSGSLYHHFDSKESIGDEILSAFLADVLGGYRAAVAGTDDPRTAIEQIVRSSTATLSRHRAALTMLQNDWTYFSAQPRFGYLRTATKEIEQTWVGQLERGKETGQFRADLDARLIYRLLRDILWIPTSWPQSRGSGWSAEQIVDGLLRLIFDGISAHVPESAPAARAKAPAGSSAARASAGSSRAKAPAGSSATKAAAGSSRAKAPDGSVPRRPRRKPDGDG